MEDDKENKENRRPQEQEPLPPQRVASGGGGQSLSLSGLNLLHSLGLSGSRSRRKNVLTGYQKSKSEVFRPDMTPVGIRPKEAVNTRQVRFEPYIQVKDALTWEAVQFMRGVMDECTHLGNFSIPVDPSLVIIVAAKNDGYVELRCCCCCCCCFFFVFVFLFLTLNWYTFIYFFINYACLTFFFYRSFIYFFPYITCVLRVSYRYMPRNGIIPLTDLWPGSEMRILKTGHVAAYLFNHQVFR